MQNKPGCGSPSSTEKRLKLYFWPNDRAQKRNSSMDIDVFTYKLIYVYLKIRFYFLEINLSVGPFITVLN